MLAVYLLGAFCGLVGGAFLLEPLVRDEEDLTPLTTRYDRHPRTGRTSTTDTDASTYEERTPDHGATRGTGRPCPHCGDKVEQGYVFCGNCASPLPTPA